MNILGISCFSNDSAAAIIRDGEIIAAAQEERFTRRKHDPGFPAQSIAYCLKEAGSSMNDIDLVAFYEQPIVKFGRFFESSLFFAPGGMASFSHDMPDWIRQRLLLRWTIIRKLGYRGKIIFARHHESHAASAFYPSPFSEAAVLTIDGAGEWETATIGIGCGNDIQAKSCLRFPHSLGFLYSAFTYYSGFEVDSGEYKLMGLAPYGKPRFKELILKDLLDLKEDGSFKLNMRYFDICSGERLINSRFESLFSGPARRPGDLITQKDMDMAASIQQVTEEIMLKMAKHAHKLTGKDNLCLAGSVALNCVANSRILREGLFKKIWVQPAAGDAGGALGAALWAWYKYLGNDRIVDSDKDSLKGSFLGPEFNDFEISACLDKEGAVYERFSSAELPGAAAELVASGKVIGWFQGRMEFGPRALGARSIIADPRKPGMQSRLNLEVKRREPFRPFAPAVLNESASDWFDLKTESPYMLLVAAVKDNEPIPAVTHVDNSARVQTVKRSDSPLYYELIEAFYRKTGCPAVVNTSFNVRGEPLVCTPQDAFRCFMGTEMDHLVIGDFILDKSRQMGSAQREPLESRVSAAGNLLVKFLTFLSVVFFGIFFCLVMIPAGFIVRLFGKDVLDLKFGDNRESYWRKWTK